MAVKGLQHAQRVTWERSANETLAILESVARGP
jgi:hypothetical protein